MTGLIDRRTFLKRITVGGGGLLLGVWLTSCTKDGLLPTTSTSSTTGAPSLDSVPTTTGIESDPSARFEPHLLLRIDGDDTVTITVPKSEMGQGVRTALAMVVAEELDADWSRVQVETARGDRQYGDQVTGGSLSISTRFDSMRLVGAAARHMLIAAAAAAWGTDPAECATEPGEVVERNGERRATYGALAALAAAGDPPSTAEVALKDPDDYRIIGRPFVAIDAPDIVRGAAVFGSDVHLPDMVHGTVARSPVFGGRVAEYDAAAAISIPGVIDVVEISTGVAVIAANTWAAARGRDALAVTWDTRGNESIDDESVQRDLMAQLEPAVVEAGELTADYTFPYCAHAAMETLTCVADVTQGSCEVWAATQHPQLARATASRGASLRPNQVTVQVPMIGGGFGRRLDQDFVEEAAELSATIARPVKLFWSRTDDLRHDHFHPASVCRAVGNPADPATLRIQMELAWNGRVPTGNWRSVISAPEAFAHESFVDELAYAARRDPYEYRRGLLDARALGTLDRAAREAHWGDPLPPGRGRGIAHYATWDVSPTTIVAEVSVPSNRVHVHRVVCAIDCGTVVNPDTVAAQIEGAVAFGLTATLLGGVTISEGQVTESNFHDSPILRFDEMPDVEVHIVTSRAEPTGIGEAGVPPVAPAIANAIFAATGQRLRDLPLIPA